MVIDDNGLTFPPGRTLAGKYLVSFEDRRTSAPAGQKLHLQFIVPGPRILLFDVPAGTASTHSLLANMAPEVVWLDPGAAPVAGSFLRPEDRATAALDRRGSGDESALHRNDAGVPDPGDLTTALFPPSSASDSQGHRLPSL